MTGWPGIRRELAMAERSCHGSECASSSVLGISSLYIALCQEGFRAQGFGTIHHLQTFELRSRTLAFMDLCQQYVTHLSSIQKKPFDFG
jgi:hypothetical protein